MHPLLDDFERCVGSRGSRIAASDQSLTLEYAALRAVAASLGSRINAQTKLERVGILAPTSTVCAAALFATWYGGKTPVPLNFLLPPGELVKVIRDAEIDLILTIDRFAPAVQGAAAGLGGSGAGLKTLVLDATTLTPDPAAAGSARAPEKRPDDLAVVLYTSGTSGDPKGVMLTFNNVVQNARACVEHARMSPDQVFLGLLPQFHSFGLTATTVIPLTLGATVYYVPRFSPVAVAGVIAEKQVSIFLAIASMFSALAHLKNPPAGAMKSVALAISGGEPLSQSAAAAFEEKFGLKIMEGYGLTETSPVVSVSVPWAHKPGSVGKPLPGIHVKAVDEAGRDVPAGGDGELLISGHCVMKGYFNKPVETGAVLRDGWLHTGDIGRIDGEGFIFITGRAKEMMIIGGENVYPREIESVLEQHPAVAEAAAIGVRDDVRGETPVAFVIPKEGAPEAADPRRLSEQLREFCRERIAGFKIPRRIHVAAELPRSPTGKILKRALKEPV